MPPRTALLLALLLVGLVGMAMAGGETPTCQGASSLFDPADSETFNLVEEDDGSYVGEDMVQVGELRVRTRFTVLSCGHVARSPSSAVDGILGLGWSAEEGSPAILKSFSTAERPTWNLAQDKDFEPIPPVYSITVIDHEGQIMLGGYDPEVVEGTPVSHNLSMANGSYAVEVTGLRLGGEELLNLTGGNSTLARIDINSLCIRIPNSTMNGLLADSPYQKLLALYAWGNRSALVLAIGDEEYAVPYSACIEPSEEGIVLGTSWLESYVMSFNFSHPLNLSVTIGRKNDSFPLTSDTGRGYAIQVTPGGEEEEEGEEGGERFSSVSFHVLVEFGSPPSRKKLQLSIDSPVTSLLGFPPPSWMRAAGSNASEAAEELEELGARRLGSRLLETTTRVAPVAGHSKQHAGGVLVGCLAACLLATSSLLMVRLYLRRRQEERNVYQSLAATEEGTGSEE